MPRNNRAGANQLNILSVGHNTGILPAQGLWYIQDISRIFTLPHSLHVPGRRERSHDPTHHTHSLIHSYPLSVYKHIVDFNAQQMLEESGVINYLSRILPNSKLIALKNRAQGDCLLDSLMQSLYGVFDETQILRNALFESMKLTNSSGKAFYNVFKGLGFVKSVPFLISFL